MNNVYKYIYPIYICISLSLSLSLTETDEQLRTAQLLVELMGDAQSMPMNNKRRPPPPNVRFTARQGNKEEKVELETMNVL